MKKVDLSNYEVLFVDMDGVIVMSGSPIPEAVDVVNRLNSRGEVFVLSNNSTRSRKKIAENLKDIGVKLPAGRVINSAFVLAKFLREEKGPLSVFTIGEEGLDLELQELGHEITTPEDSEVVAVGMDRGLTYKKLDRALTSLNGGATFFATNSDSTFPTPEGESPGAGASVGAIQGMGYEPERIVGKPSEVAANIAMEVAGVSEPSECLVIGDRLETDILLGERAGMDSALVLSGVETEESLEKSDLKPTYVVQELPDIL